MRFGYWICYMIATITLKIFWGYRVIGRDKLPREGAVIVASNHASWLDPPVAAVALHRESHFAAKKEIFGVAVIGPLIKYLNSIPVRRSGFDNEALKRFIEVLSEGKVLLMFPEGTRSRTEEMLDFRRGVGYLVVKSGAAVQPIYIAGSRNPKKSLFRKGGITVYLGEPIFGLSETFTGELRYEEIAAEIQSAVRSLEARHRAGTVSV